jgi:hypothetical protein
MSNRASQRDDQVVISALQKFVDDTRSMKLAAHRLGYSPASIYGVLSGRRRPSEDMAQQLGYSLFRGEWIESEALR